MKDIQVLGSGCTKCQKTAAIIEKIAEENNVTVEVVKVTDPMKIMAAGVMTTPAVLMNGQVIHKGSIPTREQIESWF